MKIFQLLYQYSFFQNGNMSEMPVILNVTNECRQGLSKIGNGQTKPSLILCV